MAHSPRDFQKLIEENLALGREVERLRDHNAALSGELARERGRKGSKRDVKNHGEPAAARPETDN